MSNKRCKHLMRVLVLELALALAVNPLAHAQSGGGYDLTWSTVASGGGRSTGDGYALNGSIGQPDAGAALTGGGYMLVGGFQVGTMDQYRVFLPLVLRQ